jgi:hypothetical protein
MNSDGDKIYMKIVASDKIYIFVVQFFSFKVILMKKVVYYTNLDTKNRYSTSFFLPQDDFK